MISGCVENCDTPQQSTSNVAPSADEKTSNVSLSTQSSSSSSSDWNSSSNESSSSDSSSSSSDSEIGENIGINSDDFIIDKNYVPSSDEEHSFESERAEQSELNNVPIQVSPQKGKKGKKNTAQWKRNQKKNLRNTGKAYTMSTKSQKMRHERKMKPPC